MVTTQCPICGKNEKLKLLYKSTIKRRKINAATFSARRTPDKMHYKFVVCLNCGLQFSNPIFSREEIQGFYEKSTFDYTTESNYLKKTYGKYLSNILGNKNHKNTHLLDIGCGNGFFMEEAKLMGVGHVYGVEPGKATVASASKELRKYITVDVFKKGQFKDNSLDIICCFHTLDHIIEVNSFLKNVYKVLKKGGKAYFVVHDTRGLSVKLFGERSPIYDIEHINLFNQSNLSQIFKINGFKTDKTFPVINRYPLYYWIRMTPLPELVKKIVVSAISFFHLKSFSISLNAGNIGIIAEK